MTATDLLLFGPDGPALGPDAWTPGGVRGADKVGQRVLYVMGTPQGSVPGRPTFGTTFVALAQGFRSEFDLYAAWAAIEPALTVSVQACELADEPDSERLGSARLVGVTVMPGSVSLTIDVTALDGSRPETAVEYELPT